MKQIYSEDFYNNRSSRTAHFADRIAGLLMDLLRPTSAVDLGCGVGSVLNQLHARGCSTILGVEGEWVDEKHLLIAPDQFQRADLTKPFTTDRTFDLGMSFEVAEHLDPQHADTFLDSLCKLSKQVVFSAAVEQQGGVHHVNEQWQSWWARKFEQRGYSAFDAVRPVIWTDTSIPSWYRQNTIVYLHRSIPVSDAIARHRVQNLDFLDRIHPELFVQRARLVTKGLKPLLRRIPSAAYDSVARRISGVGR
ncbi:methyltransferase domain-containing protein [Bradyrhizobium sp. LHD-71]|uniref:methyltransferase domain-containing protein n=1 Tax=Bradyrhizobium sp. LHD-71 TaxID=3072141 RepID=UPI00280EDF42|nr:methyltransferase domain-containing protein [Bradyrhizobium sp. LHD-71]MDQ8727663.1 methyltransferase domain-containing protein [Bradyrhizobium sp. LHD-71]